MQKLLFFILLISVNLAIWPQPNKISYQGTVNDKIQFTKNTKLSLQLQNNNQNTELPQQFHKKLQEYQQHIFKNKDTQTNENQNIFHILLNINDTKLQHWTSETKENYILKIDKNQIFIQSENYVGYLRALETLSQLVSQDLSINQIPIFIEDEPYLQHRGIMIDTARHFLSVETILRTIAGLQFNKMNVLHIHFTDDESFPLEMFTDPNITKKGAYSQDQVYSISDIQDMIQFAQDSGVRIIPEIDSPSHARSWALDDKYSNSLIICPGAEHYNGQLDPTLDITYELVNSVIHDTQQLFPGEYLHLGGDEVIYSCFDKRPSIKQYMEKNNIADYVQLQQLYRNKQKSVLNKGKTAIFWSNEKLNIPPEPNDVIQYWGESYNVELLKDIPNKLILSPEDKTYINTGVGFVFGTDFGNYLTWQSVYSFDPVPEGFSKDRILGSETCLWSELNNDFTHDNYLWIRSSALAERLWTEQKSGKLDVVKRLIAMQELLVSRGIEASPVTSAYCSKYPEKCFNNDEIIN